MRRSSHGDIFDLCTKGKQALQDDFIAQNPNETAIVENSRAWLQTKEEFQNSLEAFFVMDRQFANARHCTKSGSDVLPRN
mmetsp:Transcript_6845/g.9786  ORF Transcript_6845/g.9786 Transcript_6845/m.9786 type:complete len:80 (-) Transcript_6845:3-242(-)